MGKLLIRGHMKGYLEIYPVGGQPKKVNFWHPASNQVLQPQKS